MIRRQPSIAHAHPSRSRLNGRACGRHNAASWGRGRCRRRRGRRSGWRCDGWRRQRKRMSLRNPIAAAHTHPIRYWRDGRAGVSTCWWGRWRWRIRIVGRRRGARERMAERNPATIDADPTRRGRIHGASVRREACQARTGGRWMIAREPRAAGEHATTACEKRIL